MRRNPVWYLVIAIVFLFLFPLGCAIMLSGCKVMKGKQEMQHHTIVTDSTTAGAVSETKTSVNTDWEWFRNTLLMQQPQKASDTVINKNYYTHNLPQPQVIIMEGGKGKQETVIENKDSMWEQRFARLESVLQESSKQKQTQVLTAGQIIGIVAGGVLLFVILSKLKRHF